MEKTKKRELLRTLKYALIAASAGIIQIGTFTLMNEVFRWNYWVSYLVSLVLSVVWNFTFNRKYTFKSAANVPVAMLKVLAYYAVFTPLSTLLEKYLTGSSVGWNEYLVTAMNMLINFVTEFLYQRFFVFGKTIDTNSTAKKDSGAASDTDTTDYSNTKTVEKHSAESEKLKDIDGTSDLKATSSKKNYAVVLPLLNEERPVAANEKELSVTDEVD